MALYVVVVAMSGISAVLGATAPTSTPVELVEESQIDNLFVVDTALASTTPAASDVEESRIDNSSSSSSGECINEGVMYHPALSTWTVREPHGVESCQARCAAVPGCYYFSYLSSNASCALHDDSATWFSASGAISGPAQCTVEIEAQMRDVELSSLAWQDKARLVHNFVIDIAVAMGLSSASIRDESGSSGTVALSSGRISAFVLLPPGRTISDVVSTVHHSGLRATLATSLVKANLSQQILEGSSVISPADISIMVQSHSRTSCFIEGTRYEPSMQSGDGVWALTAFDCQMNCQKAAGCTHFSYWRGYKGCLLQNSSSTPVRDANMTAGPRHCSPGPPDFRNHTQENGTVVSHDSYVMRTISRHPVYVTIAISLCLLPLVLVAVYSFWKRRLKRRRAPHSRPETPDYHAIQAVGNRASAPRLKTSSHSAHHHDGEHLSTHVYADVSARSLGPDHVP